MYFTDEEKEIIKKIASRDRYSISNFFIDNFPTREKKELSCKWDRFTLSEFWFFDGGKLGLRNVEIPEKTEIFIFEESYKYLADKFVKIISILKKLNMIVTLKVDMQDVISNFINFGHKAENSGTFHINSVWCKQYEEYCVIELLVIQSDLQDFINDGFKTKEEIEREEEINARNQALADSRDSVKYAQESVTHSRTSVEISKTSLKWTIGVAIVTIIFSGISLLFTINSYNKETEVKVKNFNEINTQQLEAQLKQTNQEFKNIKTKFEELQKQSQKSTKK